MPSLLSQDTVPFIIGFIIVYFIPAVMAFANHHRNAGAILALNLLAGWSVIGWVAAMIWAFTGGDAVDPDTVKQCPFCRSLIDKEAQKCPHCAEWIPEDAQP